jgi:hypothetical protein
MSRRLAGTVAPPAFAMVRTALQHNLYLVLNMFLGWKLVIKPIKHTSKPDKMLSSMVA